MKRNKYNNKARQSGFSLLEVLIAIVIFSFALLGIAGMMTVTIRSNHNGYLRSQATILANDMASKMRANIGGLWAHAYDSGGGNVPNDISTICDSNTRCTRVQLAQSDMEYWGSSLNQLLPSGTGSLRCQNISPPSGIMSSGNWIASPPFSGMCVITVNWNESNETGSETQTLSLVIQP